MTSANAPGRSTPRSATPNSAAVSEVMRRIASSIVYFCRSRTQCEQEPRRERRVHDQADVRAGVAEADRHARVVEHLLDRVHPLVEERVVEQRPARGSRARCGRTPRRSSRRARSACAASEVVGIGGVVDGVGGEHVHAAASRAAACSSSAARSELGPARRDRRARRAARRGRAAASAAHSGARSKNVRCCSPKSRPMPRAVVCGRSSPPRAASSSTSSRILRKSSGPALLCASPNVTGRPVRRLISAIQCTSARVPS